MQDIHAALIGVGSVGRTLLNIIHEKQKLLESSFNIRFKFVILSDSHGTLVEKNGFQNLEEIAALKKDIQIGVRPTIQKLQEKYKGSTFYTHEQKGVAQVLQEYSISDLLPNQFVVFECSPVNLKTGEPGMSVCKVALSKKMHVVLANKGPLVHGFQELMDLAKMNQVKCSFSATCGGGLPIVNIAQRDLLAADIHFIRGVFNSTTNFILSEMENGREYADALKEAQERGIAETDPSLDVEGGFVFENSHKEGYDTANKLVIICNSILKIPAKLSDIKVHGITKLSAEEVKEQVSKGKIYKLVASAKKNTDNPLGYDLSVEPAIVDRTEFVGGISGWELGIEFHSDLFQKMFFKIRDREPTPTSAAMLRDALNIYSSNWA